MNQETKPLALITGAAGDIGMACATALLKSGFRVTLTDIHRSALQAAIPSLDQQHSAHVNVDQLDVSDEVSVATFFERNETTVGPASVLVCAAGIMSDGPAALIDDISLDDWQRVQAVNVQGTFLCVRQMLRHRRQHPVQHGRIITLSSAAGQLGGYRGDAAYVASKAAILGFTKIAARQVAALNITVNCVAAGPTDTDMFRRQMDPAQVDGLLEKIPLGRIGQAKEVAAAVQYLASREAAWTTGSTLDVNGGYRMQ